MQGTPGYFWVVDRPLGDLKRNGLNQHEAVMYADSRK